MLGDVEDCFFMNGIFSLQNFNVSEVNALSDSAIIHLRVTSIWFGLNLVSDDAVKGSYEK